MNIYCDLLALVGFMSNRIVVSNDIIVRYANSKCLPLLGAEMHLGHPVELGIKCRMSSTQC